MTNQELFESIQMGHKEKKVLSLSKKLVKKCSFNRGSDVENLCHLAYMCHIRAFLYAKNNDIDNAIESIKQGYENSEIPQVIIDKLVQIANG